MTKLEIIFEKIKPKKEKLKLGLINNISCCDLDFKDLKYSLGLMNVADGSTDINQIGLYNECWDNVGDQTGLVNICTRELYGTQRGIFNLAEDGGSITRGFRQRGVINYCKYSVDEQYGLINIGNFSDKQIGLINYTKDNPWYKKLTVVYNIRNKTEWEKIIERKNKIF